VARPFSPATIDAVAGCTRALAGGAGGRGADAAVLRSPAASLGWLRADGDRAAIRAHFHDPEAHRSARPSTPLAATIFDALAEARLDALGMVWLRGVANNLLQHPGADVDASRWLAFEAFCGLPAPQEKQTTLSALRDALTPASREQLAGMREHLLDARRFSTAAAAWAEQVANEVSPLLITTPDRPRIALAEAPGGVDIRRGRYALPGAQPRRAPAEDEGRSQDAGSAPAHAGPPDPLAALGYHAYTTAHDRVINAAALATRAELAALRLKMEADFASVRSTVARLAKKLMRVLMAQQAREWRFDLDEGLLDASRLSSFVASRGSTHPFKQEFDAPFPSTAVTLLIDHSGSMRGRPMQIAALTVEIFARVLERCNVTCEVLGFTTREWDGGEPAREWAANGYPEGPGRLNALEHIIIKPADVPWRRARLALGLFLRDEMLKENIDGEALAWAHGRLLARAERRRILIVVSDGTPMDEATFAANGFDYLDDHLAAVVAQIEARSPVQLAAIGIGVDVSRFYRNATRVARIDDLGPALTAKLIGLLGAHAPGRGRRSRT